MMCVLSFPWPTSEKGAEKRLIVPVTAFLRERGNDKGHYRACGWQARGLVSTHSYFELFNQIPKCAPLNMKLFACVASFVQ